MKLIALAMFLSGFGFGMAFIIVLAVILSRKK